MLDIAKWIWEKRNKENDGSSYLRKSFIIEKPVKSATISVCGLGYAVTKINGLPISEDVLTTPFTAFEKRILYNEYDVTHLLKQGENVICAEVGNGWRNAVGKTWNFDKAPWHGGREFIAQIDIVFRDGSKEIVASDRTWKATDGPTIYNHLREGEIYDARLEIDGVYLQGFDDSLWDNAEAWEVPGGILEKAELPPIKEIRTLKGEYIGNGIYDFGENTSGYVKISVKAPNERGREITLVYSEIYRDGDIDSEHINSFSDAMGHRDTYIIRGKEYEVWKPSFVYHGFRYVKVLNAPKDFEIEAKVVHTALKTIGQFECSDNMLNRIHEASVRSTLTNYHSIPTDCPHREQNGWTGDASLSSDQALMNFDMFLAYKKWMNDFKDAQSVSGQIPGIVPRGIGGYGYGPAWDSAMFMIPWNVYNVTGKTDLIEQMWDNMKLYMKYIAYRSDKGIIDYGLGDWCPPENDVVCPATVLNTAYYYTFAKLMSRCSEIMGEDKSEYEETARLVRMAWRKKFLGDETLEKYQAYFACGIYQGLFDEDEISEMAKKLADLVIENDYHMDCGILGTKYIFTALTENGYEDVAYKMVVNPTYPSYAYWINNGMTTLGESWKMENSRNHHMFSEVDNWFYKYMAGIRFNEGEVIIKPVFVDGIKWVKAEHCGIKVYWDEETVRITLPKGGTVIINGVKESKKAGEYTFKRN